MSPQVPFDPSTIVWTLDELLGDRTVSAIMGRAVRDETVTVTTELYHFGSPSSGGLVTVQGEWLDGGTWSAFVKVLQHLRHWALLPQIPPHVAKEMLEFYPWREELELWRPALVERLPEGMRVPLLYDAVDLGDERIAVWMEKVDLDPAPWSLATYARAARLIGAHNARMCDEEVVAACPRPNDYALLMWSTNGLMAQLGNYDDTELWNHPILAEYADVRPRVLDAHGLAEDALRRFADLQHGMPHGDCSPQNLLVPRDGDELVMIDISFQSPAPPGTDLAQLVVGLVHAGQVPAGWLPEIEATVLAAYLEGFLSTGRDLAESDLLTAYAGTLLIRSAFSSIPFDWVDDPARAEELRERLRLTRFILDTADRHLAS
ncbi:MAG TPA: hypothetical protein VLI04_19230 [Nocardioidaceae bacterium]|nr:hypothetical protein [Nocardioidaceae bacterium]